MDKVSDELRLYATDSQINTLIHRETETAVGYSRHFNQSEDFFIRLGHDFEVPSFSIHHDVNQLKPDASYLNALREFFSHVQPLVPGVFSGLTYLFDPAEVLRPSFFQIYRAAGVNYLYLLKLDLVYRPQNHIVVTKGTNDTTPVYRTRNLVVDASIVPLRGIERQNDTPTAFQIDQMISSTWIGETGRGYFVQGIWIDADLNKFFTKLFVPKGKRIYPYYPFTSKYRTVCHVPIGIEPEDRRRAVPLLHRTREFLRPHLDEIQSVLREQEFNESLPLFQQIRETVPEGWSDFLNTFDMDVYLNDEDMREFEVVPR